MDEIQVVPDLIPKLRWFYEKMPALPVIATGSLLDFVMDQSESSMPVGRVEYMYLEPLSFEEFLVAINKKTLFEYINQHQLSNDIPETLHQDLMVLFKEYLLVGGLPAAVARWVRDNSLESVSKVHHDLLTTYKDDFGKYHSRISKDIIDDTFLSVPRQLSEKFKYSLVNSSSHSTQINKALKLLHQARVCHKITCSHANGLPLGAEKNEKYFKVIYLDVGLCSAQLGLTLNQIQSTEEIALINRGGIAEQVVGQILRTTFPYYIDPELFCWIREEPGKNAKVDYILQHNNIVVPCEVKAGKTGSLKSLHYFMDKKQYKLALRVNSDYPSFIKDVDLRDTTGKSVNYALLSLPFYLLGQAHRLMNDLSA